MIQKIVLLFFFLSLSVMGFSQTDSTIKDYKKTRTQDRIIAQENILQMKEGVLLVRLDFKIKEVTYFEKYKNTKEANKIKKKQKELNQYIIEAIDSLFTFCPVYYFSTKDSRNVIDGKLDQVVFYSSKGEPDSTIKWKNESFFIGEYDQIEGDTTLHGKSKFSAAAFVIRDQKFQQLRAPFPYFSLYHEWGVNKKKYRMPARRMSDALELYFKKVKELQAAK